MITIIIGIPGAGFLEDYIYSHNYPAERLYKLSELGEVS